MGKFEDLTGNVYGKLKVIYRAKDYIQPSGQHKRMWHCQCECGKECDVRANDLKSGNTTSCGCFQQEARGKKNFEDLIGKRFGRLTVLYRMPNHITPSGQTKTIWKCKCDCGKECEVYATQLRKGKESCGCVSEEEKKRKEFVKELIKNEKKQKYDYVKTLVRNGNIQSRDYDDETQKLIKEYLNKKEKDEIQKTKRKNLARIKSAQKKKEYLETNSLAYNYPELVKEWNAEKNGDISPYDISKSSGKKMWWKCGKGHEWKAVVSSRIKGNGCPYCSGRNLWKGFNDLATLNPELLSEWDYKKNSIQPSEIKASSAQKVWWKCALGHSFDMKICNRTGKQKCGCPYCSIPAKRVLRGFNDLQSKYPKLAEEWNYNKNGSITPDSVLCGSGKKVWWIGKCGHEFEETIVYRVNGGGCPYCSHQKFLKGFNDVATTNPELLNEWDYYKNDVLPSDISAGTRKKVWWKCPFGHSYQMAIYNRYGEKHSGCPICDKENHTSFPEQALYYYIKKCYPDAINSDRSVIGMELDIYIPSLKIAIEYDGRNWHKNNKHEMKKNKECMVKNILLMRIREEGLALYDDCYCIVRNNTRTNDSLSEVIKKVLYDIDNNTKMDVDVDRDATLIYSSYIITRKTQSLKNTYPEIAEEWHPIKNGEITADMVAPMTNKKVWWLGKCGHEWQSTVTSRSYMKAGCPYCSGKRVLQGFNDLLTLRPSTCEDWYYEKNNVLGISPETTTVHSDKKVWWKCKKCGFIWMSGVDHKVRTETRGKSNGCYQCGIKNSAEAKHKSVKCIETGVIYKSLKEAQEKTGVSQHCISNCCKGKQKTAGKLHWIFCINMTS